MESLLSCVVYRLVTGCLNIPVFNLESTLCLHMKFYSDYLRGYHKNQMFILEYHLLLQWERCFSFSSSSYGHKMATHTDNNHLKKDSIFLVDLKHCTCLESGCNCRITLNLSIHLHRVRK